jgi:hypothetical protein
LMISRTPSPTRTAMATIQAMIDPDDGLVPGLLDINVLDSNDDGGTPDGGAYRWEVVSAPWAAIRPWPNRGS